MTAWIDLTQLSPNLALVSRLPAGLLHYYQALPLAADGAQVTVAMVYPGNRTAVAMLGDLLGAEIVPVATSAEAMQTMLLRMALQIAREEYETRRERQAQGIELAKSAGRYKGRKPNQAQHARIVALRLAGYSIQKTADMTESSTAQVKRVWAEHKKKTE